MSETAEGVGDLDESFDESSEESSEGEAKPNSKYDGRYDGQQSASLQKNVAKFHQSFQPNESEASQFTPNTTTQKQATTFVASSKTTIDPTDQGGLGGRPIDPEISKRTKRSENIERRLKSHIKHLARLHPKVDLWSESKIDSELKHLDEEELRVILDNIKQQIGGTSPYATAETVADIAGTLLEKKLRIKGYADAIRGDADIIIALDELIPNLIQDVGGPLLLLWKLASTAINLVNSPRELTEQPPQKKQKTTETNGATAARPTDCPPE